MEDVELIFRNFSGKEKRFNPKGKRNFNVLLDKDVAEKMMADGWYIRCLTPREEGDPERCVIKINVLYSEKARPPKVVLITEGHKGKTHLGVDEIGALDYARITHCDLMFRPYDRYEKGEHTRTAWLTQIYVTIKLDALEEKYRDTPDSVVGSMRDEEIEDDRPPF